MTELLNGVAEPGTIDKAKPIHTIILDTAPILLNTPPISTLFANSQSLVTTQSVLSEVRGEEARARLDTLYRPFLTIRTPKPERIDHIRKFAQKTGDSGVLSATDIELLALAYDLECERNGGDWRLRNTPGQKRLNGSPPSKQDEEKNASDQDPQSQEVADDGVNGQLKSLTIEDRQVVLTDMNKDSSGDSIQSPHDVTPNKSDMEEESAAIETVGNDPSAELELDEESSDSDEGWITPSNIKRHQAKENTDNSGTKNEVKTMQVATMTGDFAMQNVLLQMNLNLLSTKTCKRVAHIKQMILRCHGCFNTTRDMSKQFCPRCGKPTLTRVTCTTNDKGEVKLHLKTNHQWNNRGNVFSIPKPVAGSANQKWKGPRQGGGQGGWGSGLILSEDQKEYTRASLGQKRSKTKDLMDEDTLPALLTGDRSQRSNGHIRVGGGRNINSRKR